MKNPYGDDDEDFDLNFIIDRNMKVRLILLPNFEKLKNHVFLYFDRPSIWPSAV